MILSTHDLTRRSTTSALSMLNAYALSTHDLTRRSTGSVTIFVSVSSFQLTTSQGGRPASCNRSMYSRISFNSRPHKEVDEVSEVTEQELIELSTHDLTRRSTKSPFKVRKPVDLSTHDLTRRSTICRELKSVVASTFQLTTSQGGRRVSMESIQISTSFNSRPHKEVDTLAWRNPLARYLSTHDLTRRSTPSRNAVCPYLYFQLTTSQGGRLFRTESTDLHLIFQLTTSQGGRLLPAVTVAEVEDAFNSRPHKEVDRIRAFS